MNKVGGRTKKVVGGMRSHTDRSGRHSRTEEGRMEGRNRNLYYQEEEMKEGSSGQREGQREIELDKIMATR